MAMGRKCDLNLKSKQMCNLKDKDLGVRSKLSQVDIFFDQMLCDSAMRVKHLSTDATVTYVTHFMSTC